MMKSGKLSSNPRSISNNNIAIKSSSMIRSYSQDANVGVQEQSKAPKSSLSDNSLDLTKPKQKQSLLKLTTATIKEQPSTSTVDDDICSTDSSVVDDDVKKKKRKLFTFTKKSNSSSSSKSQNNNNK